MPPDPNLYLPETHVAGEVREALWRECFVSWGSPTLALGALFRFFPARNTHRSWLVIAGFSLLINVISGFWQLTDVILSHHFDINLLFCARRHNNGIAIHGHGR